VNTINTLIYSFYNLLKKYSDKHYIGLFYGYHEIEPLEEKFSIAYDFLENLRKLKFRIENDSCCPCDRDSQKLIEDSRKMVGSCSALRLDLITDSLNYDEWVLNNPEKVAREAWEKCLYSKCGKLSYNLVRDLNNASKECNLIYNLVKSINECKFSYQVENKTKDCSLDYEILMKQVKCDLSYEDFVEIHNCGATVNLVKSVISCGAKIGVNPISKCLEVTYNLKKYPINCYE
jgi:hypothetical protein